MTSYQSVRTISKVYPVTDPVPGPSIGWMTALLNIELLHFILPLPRSLPIQLRLQVVKTKWRYTRLSPFLSWYMLLRSYDPTTHNATSGNATYLARRLYSLSILSWTVQVWSKWSVAFATSPCACLTRETLLHGADHESTPARLATHTTSTGPIWKACA